MTQDFTRSDEAIRPWWIALVEAPDDDHHGRGEAIRKARRDGLTQARGSAPGLVDTRGLEQSGRLCGLVDHLKLNWSESSECALATAAVVLGLDPDHDRQA